MPSSEAVYCPQCGAEGQTGAYCTECGEDVRNARGQGEGESDNVQASQDTDSTEQDGGGLDGYAHLFGEVYWRTAAAGTDLFLLLAVPFLLLSRRDFGELFDDQLLWLLQNHPDVFEWWYYNHHSIGFILIGAALASKLRFDPDPEEDSDWF